LSNWEQATVLTKHISKNRGLFLKLPGLVQFNEIPPRKNELKNPSTPAGIQNYNPPAPHWFPFYLAWVRLSSSKRMKEYSSLTTAE